MSIPPEPSTLTLAEFQDLATAGVPLCGLLGCRVLRLERGICDVRLPYKELLLRPGGTISGPAMMALADIALYGVVLSLFGRAELAVTSDLAIRFLAKPPPGDLIARARTLRSGRRMVVGEVAICAVIDDGIVAHATGSYALPGPAA
jgi:uncharacterized protein (TIGR00369 family)